MEDIKTKLVQFRSAYSKLSPAEVREKLRNEPDFKTEIEDLYQDVFHEKVRRTCSNCWEDAFYMLLTRKVEQMVALSQRQFELKAGALLLDLPKGDNDKMATRHNLTDELAIYHLSKDPSKIKYFSRYPENWQEIVAKSFSKPSDETGDGEDINPQSTTKEAAEKAVTNAERYVKSCTTKLENALALPDGEEKTLAVEKATEALEKAKERLESANAILQSIPDTEPSGETGKQEQDTGETKSETTSE